MLSRVPRVGNQDVFEQTYVNRLKALLSPNGQLLGYEQDRATLDLGLHLYEHSTDAEVSVGQVRVWFQLKGIRASTLKADELSQAEHVSVSGLRVADIRYWHGHPEPVYLVVYLEALDRFLADDVRELVERSGGATWLAGLARHQQTTTLQMPTSAYLEDALERMPRHRSLRVDGPDFRGRPLGHRYDPLRSELNPLAPGDFQALVRRLLEVHEFRQERQIDVAALVGRDVGTVHATVGRLYLTYEWTTPLSTEFGFDPGSDFRIESAPASAHGDVLILIHSDIGRAPRPTDAMRGLVAELRAAGVEQALVFFNASDYESGLFGGWRVTLEPLVQTPQGLGSLAFNVLTATSVYLEYLDRLSWRFLNYR